jgi:hypothetical protein
MFKNIAWPAALGFLIGIGAIILLQSNVAPGGERLESTGMAVILAVGSACGALIGAVIAFAFRQK